ncbi:MAG: cell division protein FtsL [Eubacteriales bacterium]|nr:cell division protein FtsL [Eubacteriales bacterium]
MPAEQNRYGRDRRYGTTAYYTEGNTVRTAAPVPEVRPRRRKQKRQVRTHYTEARRTASVSITLPLTLLLVAAVAASLFIGYRYLCLKSSLNSHMSEVKTLEAQLDRIRTENDNFEKSIDTSVDLNYVYSVAVNELGMVHVGQDNIIQYEKTESEYVRQYEDIPTE